MSKVLLVDDEPSIRLTMSEFLRRAGYEVFAAADFESALVFESADLDVAVVDINLPGRSGIELLKEINCREPYVPVIMITGEPNLSFIPEIVRASAYDFLPKPVVKDVLLQAVGRAAEKKRLTDEKRRLELELQQRAEDLERSVTERTAQLIEAHNRLAHTDKIAALGRVAAQVAHEVRNPLDGLLLYSMHLKSKVARKLATDELQLLDSIIDTINQLTRTTEQILDYARPVRLVLSLVDLNSIVLAVLELLKSQTSTNAIEVKLNLSDPAPAGMFDGPSIRAALLNLVLNAVEAMPDGGKLSIASGTTGTTCWLVVSDTGSGMSEEQLTNVFEPFNSGKSRGLGLGMAYAKKIIEEHGGKITVDSKPGEGTRVRIDLPVGND